MTDLAKIRQAQIDAAEKVVIASIPEWLKENMRKADEAFKARGGCPGCGSQILGVHEGGCPTCRDDLY